MKILFVRPPRTYWPFNSESSSFWQPIAFCSMAAVLRENIDDVNVKILDCLPLKLGWKSLRAHIEREKPDIIAVGDETASSHEAIKLVKMAKELDPDVKAVGGGYFFGNLVHESLADYGMDFVVRKEGEITMLELVKELNKPKNSQDFSKIKGLGFRSNGHIVINPLRPFIKNLDTLPLPAYDLLPMHLYGNKSTNHKDFTAIEHGRGCTAACNFCSITCQMSNNNNPLYRTKSAKRSLEETELLIEKYKRKTFNWVDGTWNADPKWLNEYCQGVIDKGWDIQHTAWMRADFVLRDEKLGILKKQVDSGLVEAIIGAERPEGFDHELKKLNKLNYSYEQSRQAFNLLKKYKKVYTIASFIYGLPDDDKNSLKALFNAAFSDLSDFMFLLPFTPFPGTPLWPEYKSEMMKKGFKKHNFHLPIMGTKYITQKQLDHWFKKVLLRYAFLPDIFLKRYLFETDLRKRRIHLSLVKKVFKAGLTKTYNTITMKGRHSPEDTYGIVPDWYYD